MYGKDLSIGQNFDNERNEKNVFYHQYHPSQYFSEGIFRWHNVSNIASCTEVRVWSGK